MRAGYSPFFRRRVCSSLKYGFTYRRIDNNNNNKMLDVVTRLALNDKYSCCMFAHTHTHGELVQRSVWDVD